MPDARQPQPRCEDDSDLAHMVASVEVLLEGRTARDRIEAAGAGAGAGSAAAAAAAAQSRAVREQARAAQLRAAALRGRIGGGLPPAPTPDDRERGDPHRRVNQAVGLLMLTFGADGNRALACLARLGRHHSVPLDEIAWRLLAGALADDRPRPATEDETAATGEPAVLQRALAFMHRHAGEPIGVGEIAEAAAISTRELQRAFRRHRGTTPLAYLRRTRLEGAHLDLRAGDPHSGDTVASIASRWGFAHPGRFSIAYQECYEQPPSHTLRTEQATAPARPPGP